ERVFVVVHAGPHGHYNVWIALAKGARHFERTNFRIDLPSTRAGGTWAMVRRLHRGSRGITKTRIGWRRKQPVFVDHNACQAYIHCAHFERRIRDVMAGEADVAAPDDCVAVKKSRT